MERDGDDERVSVMLLSKSGKLSVARRVVLLIAYVLFIAVNVVSQTGAFGLPTNADISDEYMTAITPDGWTFSIWGLIFVLQGGGVLYAFFGPGGEFGTAMALGKVSAYWMLAWFASCTWQGLFILQSRAGMIAAAAALVSTTAFAHKASILAKSCSRNSVVQTAFVALPSSIYAGWTLCASAIGVLVIGVAFDANQTVMLGLSFGVLSAVIVVVMVQVFVVKDELFALPVCWGLAGVAAGTPEPSIRIFAIVAASVVAASALIRVFIDVLWKDKSTTTKLRARTIIVSNTIPSSNSTKEPFIAVSSA